MFTFDVQNFEPIQKALQSDVKVPLSISITKLVQSMRQLTKDNLQRVIYSRAVPWKRTRKLLTSGRVEVLDKLSRRFYISAPYGIFVEKGTRPHMIYPKHGKYLVFKPKKRSKKFVSVKEVRHPGTKPYPFFTPAYLQMKASSAETVSKAVAAYIKRHTKE